MAADVLEQALNLPIASRWQRSHISEELAACLGVLISTEIPTASKERIRGLYTSAKDAFRKSRSASPGNVHAMVTLGWITRPLIDGAFFLPDEEQSIIAELVSLFDEAEEIPMDLKQQEFYLGERTKIMDLLGNTKVSEEMFQKLCAIGSRVGYYLRARSKIGEIPANNLTADQRGKMNEALTYLQENWPQIETDYKCVNLFFTLWWRILVGNKPFEEERQILPFSDAEWQRCHDLTDRLFQLAVPAPRPTISFLRAMSKFHIGQIDLSNQEFRALANDSTLSLGGRRLQKLFMASKEGKALQFDGQIQNDLTEHQMGRIWVDKLRATVAIVPRDFDRKELRKSETRSDFHIAFSFAGAIAQPQHFLRNR